MATKSKRFALNVAGLVASEGSTARPATAVDVFSLNRSRTVRQIATPPARSPGPSGFLRPRSAESWRMSALTRRLDPDALQETWLVYLTDVHVGAIMRSVGNPNAAPQWQWRCGFYPGSKPGECASGTATSFNQARADFERAWQAFSAKRTEADYQAWRDQRDRPPRGQASRSETVCCIRQLVLRC